MENEGGISGACEVELRIANVDHRLELDLIGKVEAVAGNQADAGGLDDDRALETEIPGDSGPGAECHLLVGVQPRSIEGVRKALSELEVADSAEFDSLADECKVAGDVDR